MRTTVDLDEDILRVVKDLARESEQSMGRVLSELARRGLTPQVRQFKMRNGVPLLIPKPGARPVTSEHVKELLELDD
ncbi:MAG: hypothetical protein ABSF22_09450 [Bryobacteraceae bacterium]